MPEIDHFLVWAIDETAGFDASWARVAGSTLVADGHAVGQRPTVYSVSYRLETGTDFIHRRLAAESRWAGGSANLELLRDAVSGGWTVNGESRPDLADAFDCDLQASPLTNTMPVLRHALHRQAADLTFLMAFVELPSLRVTPNRQRYTHVAALPEGGLVRYRSGRFSSDLTIDGAGFVVDYPQLGHRIEP